MNEKINLQGLIALLAEKSKITKKEAEIFLKEFFQVINDGLFDDELVKIKNLGSFKLTTVNDRESVDVTNGDRVLIPAHYKVTFSPDVRLAETVNEPFSFFEIVEMAEDSDKMEIDPDTEEKKNEDPDKENGEEIREEIREENENTIADTGDSIEINGDNENREEKRDELFCEFIKDFQEEITEDFTEKNGPPTDNEKNRIIEVLPTNEYILKKTITNPIETASNEKPADSDESKQQPLLKIDKIAKYVQEKKADITSDKKTLWGWIFYILALLIIAGIYFYYEYEERKQNKYIDNLLRPISEIENKKTNIDITPQKLIEEFVSEGAIKDTSLIRSIKKSEPSFAKKRRIEQGDRLTTIALEEYGHKSFWIYIYQENKESIRHPDNLPAGADIVIPPASKYGINKNDPESIRNAEDLAVRIIKK
jgi:nucleoid DNA-binding protein